MFYLNDSINYNQLGIYMIAQFIGTILAYNYYTRKIKTN
jgi:hypothetical protein